MKARMAPPPICPGPIDVERTHGDGRQVELRVVRVRHVLACELRHGIRPPRLPHRADGRHVGFLDVERVLAEHLARRELDHPLDRVTGRERGLERVVRSDHVDAHGSHGAREHGVDPGDPCGVDDVGAPRHELRQPREVEHVTLDEAKARVLLELGARQRVAVKVVERDDLVLVDESPSQRRADEAGAARDQHALPLQWHAGIVDGRVVAPAPACGSSDGFGLRRRRSM